MSLFDDASLVMIPSAYKDGKLYSIKPTDGSGDFTFTRGSNLAATRVDVNGLIEKGRENLVLQSNQFDTTWGTNNASITSGQIGYDGSSDAWLLSKTDSNALISQSVSKSGVQTYSIYAKAGTLSWCRFLITATTGNQSRYFDLSTGTKGGSGYGTEIDSTITSVGSGWHRITLTFNESTTSVRIYPADGNLDISGTSGNILIQDAQLEQGLVATDYIETTTTTAQAGILEDMARLDYSGGASCPSLLLEPQRTNVVPYSEYFGAWTKSAVTITANAEASPDGYTNADKLIATASSGFHSMSQTIGSKIALTPYTFSFFAKADEIGFCVPNISSAFSGTQLAALINLSDGTASGVSAGLSVSTEDYGNGWYRIKLTATSQNNTSSFLVTINATNASGVSNFAGDGTSGILLYGAQLEQGSYATSYIPTYGNGTSVTRSGDACSKTGVSDLIGQTEGTIFIEFDAEEDAPQNMNLINFNNSTQASVLIAKRTSGELRAQVFAGGSALVDINSAIVSGKTKAAIAYKSGDSVLYVNGVGVSDSSTFTFNGTLSDVIFPSHQAYFNYGHKYSVNQALLFKTRLSNAELEALTSN